MTVSPTAKLFTRDGDVNQEDITSGAVRAWRAMRCFRFSLTDNPVSTTCRCRPTRTCWPGSARTCGGTSHRG